MNEQDILAAREDEQKLAELIAANRAFILRCASETTRRYITDSDDEWSVALLAFTEAVRDFEGGKGSFRGFAAVVIRRRVTDYIRSESRRRAEMSVAPETFEGSLDEDEAGGVEFEVQRRMAADPREDTAARAREEIEAMQQVLGRYGFSFFDLSDCSPKLEKTRRSCAQAVCALMRDPDLLARLRKSGALPMKELTRASGVSKKILDRHRRYLIAAAEILTGDYPILAGYMRFIRDMAEGRDSA